MWKGENIRENYRNTGKLVEKNMYQTLEDLGQ